MIIYSDNIMYILTIVSIFEDHKLKNKFDFNKHMISLILFSNNIHINVTKKSLLLIRFLFIAILLIYSKISQIIEDKIGYYN